MPVDLMSVRHFLLAVFGRQEVGHLVGGGELRMNGS